MMFGAFAFGTAPLGVGPDFPMPPAHTLLHGVFEMQARSLDPRLVTFEDMTRTAVHAVTIKAYQLPAGPEVTLYLTDHEFVTQADDEPAERRFAGRLETVRFSRSMVRGEGFGGLVRGTGELVLLNMDGAYDDLEETYALDGREVEVRVGRRGDYFDDMMPVFRGTVFALYVEKGRVSIQVRDRASTLDVPMVEATYAGTGGLEGGDNLFMKRKPRPFGDVSNISPVLVWPQKNIYQVNGPGYVYLPFSPYGYCRVMVNGADVQVVNFHTDMDIFVSDNPATAPGAGKATIGFNTLTGELYVRLGTVPDSQIVTVTVKLLRNIAEVGDLNKETKASVISDMAIMGSSGYSWPDDFDAPAFDRHYDLQPYSIGLWLDQDSTDNVSDGVERVCGEATFVGFNGEGEMTIGLVSEDMGTPAVYLNEANILLDGIETVRLPDALNPPPWMWRLGWMINWTDMQGRIAAAVDATRRAFLSESVRVAGYAISDFKTVHPLAQVREAKDDLFADGGGAPYLDAAAEAERLFNLYSQGRRLYRIRCKHVGLLARFGTAIHVTHRRFGLQDGKVMMVVSDEYDARTGVTTLVGFG